MSEYRRRRKYRIRHMAYAGGMFLIMMLLWILIMFGLGALARIFM